MRGSLPFFGHDNDARNHPKMKALRARYGWVGYGQFWALNELIASATGARLDLSRKLVRAAAACELGMSAEGFEEFLAFLADPEECGLIDFADGVATTGRTQDDLARVEKKRLRDRSAGWPGNGPVGGNQRAASENGETASGNGEIASENALYKIREEEIRKEQEPRAREEPAEESCEGQDSRLFEYALALAGGRRAKNPRRYARYLVRQPDVRAAYQAQAGPERIPDWTSCPPPEKLSEEERRSCLRLIQDWRLPYAKQG